MAKEKAYMALSGGLDSACILYHMMNRRDTVFDVQPIFFRYGSKHNEYELQAAQRIVAKALPRVNLQIIELTDTNIFANCDSALLAKNERAIPCEPYAAEGSLAATVVPGRNLIITSILASLAEAEALRQKKKVTIAIGVHASDHALYPDCRAGFIRALKETITLSTEGRVVLDTPFIDKSKADIVRLGHRLNVPFQLTRSCYKQEEVSCGVCATCRERRNAFSANGFRDPIAYATPL